MHTPDSILYVQAEDLLTFVKNVFVNLNISPADAAIAADVLVNANLRGIDSHGVAHLRLYVRDLLRGSIDPTAKPIFEQISPTFGVVDGRNGFGPPIASFAMDYCLEIARKSGIACVAVRNGNHFGTAGYYAMRALKEDMIGIAMTNSFPLVAPTFGAQAAIGTNPIAIAVPTEKEPPFVLDMATSVRPLGEMIISKWRGERMPEGIAISSTGESITDPAEIIESVRAQRNGALLPLGSIAELGSYKGYGLSIFVDILCGVLSGSAFGVAVGASPTGPANVGHWFMALDIEGFQPKSQFKKRMDIMLREVKSSKKLPGQERIFVAGESAFETEVSRSINGIPIDPNLLQLLKEIGEGTKTHPGFIPPNLA